MHQNLPFKYTDILKKRQFIPDREREQGMIIIYQREAH